MAKCSFHSFTVRFGKQHRACRRARKLLWRTPLQDWCCLCLPDDFLTSHKALLCWQCVSHRARITPWPPVLLHLDLQPTYGASGNSWSVQGSPAAD